MQYKDYKRTKDWTLEDFINYTNYRVCDGNWSLPTAIYMAEWRSKMPLLLKRRWWKQNKTNIIDCSESCPLVNIKTGEIVER